MSNARGTAKPLHTIIRYRPQGAGLWRGWRPVEIVRFRLFVNATHAEVTGETGHGAPWDHDWSCESLCYPPDGGAPYWWIDGRSEWPTPAAAMLELEPYTFATFEEAREIAIGGMVRLRDARVRAAAIATELAEAAALATAPELPA